MSQNYTRFDNDSVMNFTPITFGAAFVRDMRKQKGAANIPSVRTTIAIPKFLTARYFRQEKLDPRDYYEAAVYNTPYEDQEIAKKVAYKLLFPKAKKVKKKGVSHTQQDDTSHTQKPQSSGIDDILGELNDAGLDDILDDLDNELEEFDKLDEIIDEQQKGWDYIEALEVSQDPHDKAILDALSSLESEYQIVEHSIDNDTNAIELIRQLLAETAGSWPEDLIPAAHQLGMDQDLLNYAQMPWEMAASLAISNHEGYQSHMDDILESALPISLGYTYRYLDQIDQPPSDDWVNTAFNKSQQMADYHEFLKGLQEYRKPPSGLIDKSAKTDIRQSLDIAEQIEQEFGPNHSPELFEKWQKQLSDPSVDKVLQGAYDDGQDSWNDLLKKAVDKSKQNKNYLELADLAQVINQFDHDRLNSTMRRKKTNQAKDVATQSMQSVPEKDQFLPQLDHFIQQGINPDYEKTVKAGKSHDIMEETVAEYFDNPLELMKSRIKGNNQDKKSYKHLVQKIDTVPAGDMQQMMLQVTADNNTVGMAAMGAADLGQALKAAKGQSMANGQDAQVTLADSLDKSIGGGTNLLKQWFTYRRNIPAKIKDRIKQMMRDALLEIGMEWANKGTGSSEEGLIPVLETRPFRPGDELDQLDIQATLDAIITSGKKLEQITYDELMVSETSKGKTSLGVLIDISGSMSGKHLAMCAIAVVMLLGKLDAKEVAIALFESNSHVIKGFEDDVELDIVADELLDLKARGGTRIDSALRWIGQEFIEVPDSEVRILYLLSDFMLSEKMPQLEQLCEPLLHHEVKLLAAYHGRYDKQKMQGMVDILGGNSMKITNFDDLPSTISDAISMIIE